MKIGIVSKNPMDYIRVALALETLAYHNKNYLCNELGHSECNYSEEIQGLLKDALKASGDDK